MGGFSNKNFASLNLAYHVRDDPKLVTKNRELVASIFEAKNLYSINQIHSSKILFQDDIKENSINGDGIICNKIDKSCLIMIADCACVIIYDTENSVFAILHVGRAGAINNILSNAISILKTKFNSLVSNLKVYISPHIKVEDYEIKINFPTENKRFDRVIIKDFSKFYFDLGKLILNDLELNGIVYQNIELSDVSTFRTDNLYSYRRSRSTGRFGVVAKIIK